jgi:putative transposase
VNRTSGCRSRHWRNHRRGHSGRDHLPPVKDCETPIAMDFAKDRVVCREELGGQLKS